MAVTMRRRVAQCPRAVRRTTTAYAASIGGSAAQLRAYAATSGTRYSAPAAAVGAGTTAPFAVGEWHTAGVTSLPTSSAAGASPALPSPVEVHQVVARAAQRGQWEHAMRLLLGALHSHCVPLAETYHVVLLAVLRGGGWQAIVRLTQGVATSALSATALYLTTADLLLMSHQHDPESSPAALERSVAAELVPLMLADATQYVVWHPRHREAALRALQTADQQLASTLFRRWSAAAPRLQCGAEEAGLLMAAFSATGDWAAAEALRGRVAHLPAPLLVLYVRAFVVAVQHTGSAPPSQPQPLVPWEMALDVASPAAKAHAPLQVAIEELLRATQHATPPTDASRWWWAAGTTTQMRLMELRRRVVACGRDAAQLLLTVCHVTSAQTRVLLEAVRASGVLSEELARASTPHFMMWLETTLVLCRHCPHALVSASGCADGLAPLLPRPHTPLLQTETGASLCQQALWQHVVRRLTGDDDSDVALAADVARHVVCAAASLHYLHYAAVPQTRRVRAEVAIAAALTRLLSRSGEQVARGGLLDGAAGGPDALGILLQTLGACVEVPTVERCVAAMARGDAAGLDDVVDVSVLRLVEPLGALGAPEEVCDAICAVGEAAAAAAAAPSPSSAALVQLAHIAVVYTCNQLRCGVALVTLRPSFHRIAALLQRLPRDADAVALLSAHLQWRWGASVEALRAQAVPLLLHREQWAALSQVLRHLPLPLSTQEQRVMTQCQRGAKVAVLQSLIDAQDAQAAWVHWRTELRDSADALPPCDALVSLLLAQGHVDEAHAVLSASGAGVGHPPQHVGLRVYDGARRRPRCERGLTLAEVWAVAGVGAGEEEEEGCGGGHVQRRETAVPLGLTAALALHHSRRPVEAAETVAAAVDHVLHYDAAHHHRPNTIDTATATTTTTSALRRTDAQLAARLPDYVQCAAPHILVGALGSSSAVSAAARSATYLLPLTSVCEAAVMAWSEALPQLYAAASALAAEALPAVVALGQRLLQQAVAAPQAPVSPALVELLLTAGALPASLVAAARTCLLLHHRATSSPQGRADGAAVAARVAHSLAAAGDYAGALEWAEDVARWPGSGGEAASTVVDAATQLVWMRAAHDAAQHRANERAVLCHRRRAAQAAAGRNAVTSELHSREALDRLLACDAWEEALDAFLHVAVAAAPSTTDALTAAASLEQMELRDALLSEEVLNRVMLCVARCAPWRTTAQAWVLLTHRVPLLPWRECADEAAPSVLELPRAMLRQGAAPHEVGTVVVWLVARLSPSASTTAALAALFAESISAASSTHTAGAARTWTAAEARLCADCVAQLRRLCGEHRVQGAARAIAVAQAAALPLGTRVLVCGGGGEDDTPSLFSPPSAVSWLPPGRPSLSAHELDALAVVAPMLLLASVPQLEALARQLLDGRFAAHELKALLHLYRDELLTRIAADGAPDTACVEYLTRNTALLVLLSQCAGPHVDDEAAARWMVRHVFDGLLSQRTAAVLWRDCGARAAQLAGCRWSSVSEAELCDEVLRHHGRPPPQLCTAPQLSRRAIAHYWSCFHRLLLPDLHFGPLELCCLAAYAPALTEARTKGPGATHESTYADAVAELASHAHSQHFCASRVPADDTLAHLRRPHSTAAIAAVMTSAAKKLKALHAQLAETSSSSSGGAAAVGYQLRSNLAAAAAAAADVAQPLPPELQSQHLAAAVRRIANGAAAGPPGRVAPVSATHARITSPLLRQWSHWAAELRRTGSPPRMPPAASLLMVEWTKEALQAGTATGPHGPACALGSSAAASEGGAGVRALWRAVAREGKVAMQQQRCHDLSAVWRLLTETQTWSVMDAGHVAVLRRLVCPTTAAAAALPSKGASARRTHATQRGTGDVH